MNGRKRLKLYAGGAVLAASAVWACWWWLSSEYSPLLYDPPPARGTSAAMRKAPVTVPAAAKPRPLPSDPSTLLNRLSAGADQPGIVVCEPVVRGADPGTARFSTGCSRWLSFALGGVPALGSTPSWDTISTVIPTLGLRDLRLSAEQAGQLARPLGVPYAAVGEISGTPSRATLTYRVYEIPSGKAKGNPATVTGTLEEITGKLPEVAAGMLRAANVPETRVGDGLKETASTLTALGAYPWRAEAEVPKELEKLSYRSRLASVVMLTRTDVWDMMLATELQRDLAERFPGHPLALQMATLCVDAVPEQNNSVLKAVIKNGEEIRRQYPFSCLTQMALAMAYWRNSQFDDARDAAEAAVVSCNRSADAWSLLATFTDTMAADAASTANRAAYAQAMAQFNAMNQGAGAGNRPRLGPAAARGNSPSTAGTNTPALPGGRSPEQDAWYRGMLLRRQVTPLFRRAVALDDRRWDIWRNYCSAACRESDWATASTAFRKAAPLCAGDADTIHAGLDLWSEWHPQGKEFQRVVQFALAHPSGSRFQRKRLAEYFQKHRLTDAARKIDPKDPEPQVQQVAVNRGTSPPAVPKKLPLATLIKTPPPGNLSRQKIAGPWLIQKSENQPARLAWNADGSVLAMADGWPGAVVWKGGTTLQRLDGAPQEWMYDVAWTSSGELVGAVQDGRLVYWNAVSGQVLRTVPRPRGTTARSIAIRPSGDRIVFQEEQQLFSLFSMPDQRRIPMRFATIGDFPDAAFSPDGAQLATIVKADKGAELLLRSPEDGRELHRIEPPGNVEQIAWRPDSKAIAVGVSDDTVRVYDLDGKELSSRHVQHRPLCMAWGPGGKLLAFGTSEGVFLTWNPATGELRQSPRGHKDSVQLLAWDQHGDRIATWGYDGALLLWNPNALAPAPALQEPPTAETTVLSAWKNVPMPDGSQVSDLAFAPDSRALTAASTTGASLYEMDTGRAIQQFKPRPGAGLEQMFLSPDGKTAYAIGFSEVWAWDRASTQVRWTWKPSRRSRTTGYFGRNTGTLSPDGRWLVAALSDGDGLHVWDTAAGREIKQLAIPGMHYGVQFSPDGKWLAVAYGSDERWADIDLYDASTFMPVGTLAGHHGEIRALCFSPDGSMLASLSADRTARLWSIPNHKQIRSLPVLGGRDGAVAFLSGGKHLFTQSANQVRVWEPSTGKLLKDVHLKKENLSPLTFSADGKLAANQVLNNMREQKRSVQVWRVSN